VIDAIANDSTFGFVIVTLFTADPDPTSTRPNASDVGENVAGARIPVPLSSTDWGLPAASSLIVKSPLRAPVWVGLNVALIVQVPFGARSLPLHVSPLMENWPDTVTVLMWRATVFGLLRVVVFAALVAPTTTLPNPRLSGFIGI